ncbi:ArsR family transcriptional regulator [Thermococcus guaymasensis DSM 11113]|uniref:ArsR family transcriptional regulator n=1 Tax=Thermococcus guaymasensis DSM 11113 TaxID=1432656 RepID=A0A0X1KJ59_9EURY|nr:ATP-binding protein [Thermococcus guaymasensis]AJC71285.1 ArsR family transcriptional regulator [Thermococcus guaymasensis DSM 11113]
MILASKFIDRERELEFLKEKYDSGAAELIILYGRRRVGKTYLLQRFLSEVNGLYLLAEESETILEDFSERLADYFDDPVLRENPLRNWRAFFAYLAEKSRKRLVVVIDEVQYIAKAHREFLSVLQKYWDTSLSGTKIMLILCGSLVSFMEGVLSAKSPLYGRRTGAWKVEEMGFFSVRKFHPLSLEDAVRVYGVFGGVPQYWADYNPNIDFWENLRRLLLSKGAKYYDEPKYLLREELRDVSRYFSILRAIALGYNRFGQIAEGARIEKNSLGKYLGVLQEMGYVREEFPVTGGRRGIYRISDNLFAFWFRFVYPRKSEIEMGFDVVDEIKEEFNQYLGPVFEEVAKQFLIELNRAGQLPFKFTKIGRWWRRGEEIDLVALNERERKALLVEVKWKELSEREARGILKDLERKAELVGLEGWEKSYGVVAKGVEGKEELKEEGFLVWDLAEFERLI